jgi:hypothetical protein
MTALTLATNYAGLVESLLWLGSLLVAILFAFFALILCPFASCRRESQILGDCALGCSCIATLLLFFSVIPVARSSDGYLTETRWTLITIASCAGSVLAARLIGSFSWARRTDRVKEPPQ